MGRGLAHADSAWRWVLVVLDAGAVDGDAVVCILERAGEGDNELWDGAGGKVSVANAT